MNKLVCSIIASALLMAVGFSARAQSQNVIKVNILSPLVRTANFSFEHALSETSSFQIGFFYTGYRFGDTRFSGVGITPEYRFYLSERKQAPAGFYVAPFLRYQNFKLTETALTATGSLSLFGLGATAGYNLILKDRFSLDFFLGPSYSFGSVKSDNGTADSFSTGGIGGGFGLRTGITFGIAF